MDKDREFRVYWSVHGICIVKAKNREEAFNKAFENKDTSNPTSDYVINQIVDVELKEKQMNKDKLESLTCKGCPNSRLVYGKYWWCDVLRSKIDADDKCHRVEATEEEWQEKF